MKQTVFLAALTAIGAVGSFAFQPFIGVAIYYLFAVLRPQYLWKWALPPNIAWSEMVAVPTILATGWFLLTQPAETPGETRRRFSGAHKAFLVFGAWICVTYMTSLDQDTAWPFFIDYLKIFLMFVVATLVIRNVRQVLWIYMLSTASLIYIAYEMNYVYITAYRLDIYHNGYGGLDNNGAGLMLAMGIPLAIHGWEAVTSKWRWLLIAGVPILIHAVLMSYSRGAMLSLVVALPLIILRSRRKRQFALVLVGLLAMIPYLAGDEIRNEFYSVKKYDTDSSASQRFDSWSAAVAIANEYPVFGAGIRNSTLLTLEHGADRAGRVIHSQYLQYLADAGYPGLTLYLLALFSLWVAMARTRRMLKRQEVPDGKMAHSMLNGVEGAVFVFCIGASFLSLEVFELPYVMALLGAQIGLLTRLQAAEVRDPVPAVDGRVPFPLPHRA